jgi:steroid delta-isomerase-like uncharacterized protein
LSLSDDITLGPLTAAIPRIDWARRAMFGQGRWSPFTRSASRPQRPLADRYHALRKVLPMSLEDNKAIIRSYVETVWNQRQLDRAEEFVAPDFLDHAPLPGQAPGLDGARRKWAMYLNAAPDLRVTIEDLVAEDDRVGVRRSYAGTHRGELLGIPATGKQVRIGSISIFRLAEGKIVENWEQLDLLTLMQQLGVIPAPAAPAAPTT